MYVCIYVSIVTCTCIYSYMYMQGVVQNDRQVMIDGWECL